LPMQDVI